MTEQEAIKQLQFDMEMITFNPNTGEDISLEVLKLRNEENYKTYLADEVAIKALEEVQQYRAIENELKERYRANVGIKEVMHYFIETIFKGENHDRFCFLTNEDAEQWEVYNAIGTVEECRAAVEKQISKRPDIEGDGYADGHLVYDTWICPNCNKHYEIDYDNYEYCPNCGQHIDRSQLN